MSGSESVARRDLPPIALAVGVFAALSVFCSRTSEGFLEADACTHYLYARFAFERPDFLVNIWGRPICTAIYSLPAAVAGRFGVHLMSLALAIGTALVAWRIAVNQGYRHPALALMFTLAQPLVFLHSFSELTELPFAFLLACAFWAYQQRQWLVMAVLIALSPLSRPEGFGFLALAGIALLLHRRWWWLVVLPVPLILWNLAGWLIYNEAGPWWRWLIDQWPYSETSVYPRGNILHFVAFLPAIVSPFVFPAMCVGVWRSTWRGRADSLVSPAHGPGHDAQSRTQLLIAVIPLLILFGHSVLYAMGKLASSGELRYMLVVAPFWGLLAAKGWEWLFERFNGRRPLLWAGVAALLPIVFNAYYKVVPLVFGDDWLAARRAVIWYRTSGLADSFPRVATAHPGIVYFMDVAPGDKDHAVEWRKAVLSQPADGTIVIYDPMYSVSNSDANRSISIDELRSAGWIDVTALVPSMGKRWHVLVSPRDAHGADARASRHFPWSP
jgi:hypothetical protein